MLEKIIEYIKQKYNPLSIILYGSYANGTNNLNSDFDALVISYDHEQFHDTSFVNDIQLDVFVYPASYFDGEFDCNNFIQIFDGKIIVDNEERGKTLQMKVLSYLNSVYTRSGQNSTPNSNATNLHSSQKRCCSFCISSSNASPTFQVQKSIFHQMTKPIQVTVILPLLLAISFSRNDDIHSSISGISNDLIGVIPTIGQ